MIKRILSLMITVSLLFCLAPTVSASEGLDIKTVAAGKNNGGDTKYTNFRIPGIAVTKKDTVIIYFEARMTGSDWADMDIVAMRSVDGGETFGEPIIIAEGASSGQTMNNPVMIVGSDGTLHMLYCVEYGVCTTCNDGATLACTHGPGVFHCTSKDDGLTWSAPTNISNDTYSAEIDHYVIATGPGHGICLSDGTLIATVWFVSPDKLNGGITSHHIGSVTTLYSKDNGKSWNIGEEVPAGSVADPNETMLAETSDGGVMLNIRSGGGGYRALAWSDNGYSDWTTMEYDTDLIDPTCMGSLAAYDIDGYPYSILLTNCDSNSSRTNLTLKASTDDGKTWTHRMVIDSGSAGYSDIAVDSKGTIYVLYEKNYGVTCSLARFDYDTFLEIAEKQKPRVILEDSLLLHLDGESFADRSGYQPDAEAVNVTANGEYSFNGKDSYLNIPSTDGMTVGRGGFTYSVKFKLNNDPTALLGQQILFWYGGVGAGLPQIWCRTNGKNLQCNIASDRVETILTVSDAIEPDKWHHAVIVRDGTEHYLYIDGALAASKSSDLVHNITGDRSFTVGSSKGSTQDRFVNGIIDDIMFFNFAMTEDEVSGLYSGELPERLDEKVCQKDESCPLSAFDDIPADLEYHNALHYIVKNGIMNGTGGGKFTPDGSLTRAMAGTVLWRMAGSPASEQAVLFGDVKSDTWYTEAVRWAASEGIVTGYSDTVFAPDDTLTREQLAVILLRYENRNGHISEEDSASVGITDIGDVSDWAKEAVMWAKKCGVLEAANGMIRPKAFATRSETALALYQMRDKK